MDALFAVEAHPLAVPGLVEEGLLVGFGLERGGDEVDSGGEIVGTCGDGDGGAGVQELVQGRGAGEGEVEGEVFGGEDEAREQGRRGADRGQVGEGLGGFDEGEDRDRRVG